MLPIHTILHPTDLSENSQTAFNLACALARDYHAKLIVLHVWSPPPIAATEVMPVAVPTHIDTDLKDDLIRLRPSDPSLRMSHLLVEGEPVTAILEEAKINATDLIVMGTHGRTGLQRLLMGSVAEQIVRQARCPVVTVKMRMPEAQPNEALTAHAAPPVELQAAV